MKAFFKKNWIWITIAIIVIIVLIIYLIKKPSTTVVNPTAAPAASTSLWGSIISGATAIVGDFTGNKSSTNNNSSYMTLAQAQAAPSSGTLASSADTANLPANVTGAAAAGCPVGYYIGQGCAGVDPNGTSYTLDTCGFECDLNQNFTG